MEAECNISRRSQDRLGITVIPWTDKLKIIWVDGKGLATTTNVFFRGTAYVGIGLRVNDEIKKVNNTTDPYGMIKEVMTADKLCLLIHRPPLPPPNRPPPRSKLNTILEETGNENDDA